MVEAKSNREYFPDSRDKVIAPRITTTPPTPVDKAIENKTVESFFNYMAEAKTFFDTVNPYSPQPLKPYLDKADSFLRRHAGISYEELLRQVNPATLEGGYYDLLTKDSLKRKLFNYRARVYLAALQRCEEEGLNLEEIITTVRTVRLPLIKKEEKEAAFEIIFNLLKKQGS
ncbi:MAG: hypothetical protein AABX13_00775 [Nanoarchaeota archaeon]